MKLTNEMKRFFNIAGSVGLVLIKEVDITRNILDALDLLTTGRDEQISAHVHKIVQNHYTLQVFHENQ